MNNDDLVLKMILDESGFTAGMNNAVKKLGTFDGTIKQAGDKGGKSLGSIWKVFAGSFLASGATRIVGAGFDLIKGSISGAIDRVDTMNNAVRNFQNMGFEKSEINRTIGKNGTLSKGIQGLPTALNDAISHVQLLASSTGDLGRSDKIFRALNDGILGFGGTTDQVNEAVIQLSQSFSNGKVDAQTWNSMINAQMGPTLSAIAKKMGITMGQLKSGLSEGKISVKTFQDQLIEMDTKGGGGLKSLNQIAKDSTKGIKTSIQNARTAVTRGVGEIIESLNKALVDADLGGFKGIIDKFGGAMESFLKVLAANIPKAVTFLGNLFRVLENFASGLKVVLPFLIPFATAFGAFMFQLKGIPTIIKSFNNLKMAITGIGNSLKIMGAVAAANPFVLIIGAVIGAIAVFGYFMATNEDFRDKVISIWNSVKDTVVDVLQGIKQWGIDTWNSIKDTWSNAKQWFSDLWSEIKNTANDLWQGTIDSAKSAVQGIKDACNDTKQWFGDLWQSIKDTASKLWSNFSEAIMPYISPIVDGITNAFSNVKEGLSTIFTEIGEIAGNAFEILKNIILAPVLFVTSMISGGWVEARNNMIEIWNNISEAAGNIWLSIKTIISTYFTMLVDSVIGVATGWYQTLVNIFVGIKNGAISKINEMVAGVKNWWSNLVTSVKTFATDLKNSAIQAFENMKAGAIQRVKDLKNNAVNTWQTLKNNVVNTANKLVAGAENAWENLKRGVSNTVNRVKNIFDDLKNINLFEIGKNIIDGLINGIQEKFGDLKKKVSDIAGTITSGLKNLLNIHSPSRLMRDLIGRNVVLGIIEGIDQTSPQLKNSLDNLPFENTELPTVNLKSKVENNNLANETKASGSNVGTNENQEIHLHLTVYGDMPDSVIRQMAKKMKIELARLMQNDADAVGGVI